LLVVTGVFAQVTHVLPFLSAPAPTYQTATVSRGNVSVSVSATGPVSPVVSVPLSFKTSGKLSEIKVNLGQKVTKGQVLATLDPSDLQTALDQAKANLAIQQANLDKLQAGATDAQKQVAQAQIDAAKSAAGNAAASVAAASEAASKDVGVSQAGVGTAATGVTTAQSALASAQDQQAKGMAADQVAVTNAQKTLATAQDQASKTLAADQTAI